MQHSELTCSIILQSIIKIFQIVSLTPARNEELKKKKTYQWTKLENEDKQGCRFYPHWLESVIKIFQMVTEIKVRLKKNGS